MTRTGRFTAEERRVLGSALSSYIASLTSDFDEDGAGDRSREVSVAKRLAAAFAGTMMRQQTVEPTSEIYEEGPACRTCGSPTYRPVDATVRLKFRCAEERYVWDGKRGSVVHA